MPRPLRRTLLQSLALAPVAALGAPDAKGPDARVTGLEVFQVKVNARGNWVLVRVSTDRGITGVGDASQGGNDEITLSSLKRFFDLLKGRSVHDIEEFRKSVEPLMIDDRRTHAAFGSLEQALWDLRGKLFGVPAYDLLGGRIQPEIRTYANINRSTPQRTPEGFAKMAQSAVNAGFDAVKLAPFDEMPRDLSNRAVTEEFTKRGIACAQAVRDAIGPQRDLLIDVHSHLDRERGIDLTSRLEPLRLFWLEEVTPPDPVENLAAIHRAAKMKTAGGELLYGVQGFYPYIAGQAVDIVMPDVKYCGGLFEMKKIAALAEAAGLQVSPHGPASPVGNAAAAQVSITMPNFLILELSYGEVPWRAEVIDPPEQLNRGRLDVSNRPGFGIALNDKTIAKYAVG